MPDNQVTVCQEVQPALCQGVKKGLIGTKQALNADRQRPLSEHSKCMLLCLGQLWHL